MSTEYDSSTDYLQQLATSAKLEVQNTRSMIWNLAEPGAELVDLRDPSFAHTVGTPVLQPPPQLSDVLDVDDTTSEWMNRLNADTDAWLDKYFPAVDECLKTLPEDWLCGVIGGTKPFGLDATVFELVWHRARDRAYRTQGAEQRQLEAKFSAAGWTLPPGAMAATLAATGERASDAIAEVNREQAIKDAEIKLELLKFATEQALNYKRGVLAVLADFTRQWMTLPNNDMERARLKTQAMNSLYSALSSYYNVQATFEELKLKAKQADTDTDLAADRNRIANVQSSNRSGKAQALAQAAQAYGDIASQAAAGAGSLVAKVETT